MVPEPRPTPEEICDFVRETINGNSDFETDLVSCAPQIVNPTELVVDFQRLMPGYYTRATRVRIKIELMPGYEDSP